MPGFGEKLRAFRVSRPEGASLDSFYEGLGVSGATGSRYEAEKTEPTLSFLQELWGKYRIEASHLMPGNPATWANFKVDGPTLEQATALVNRLVVEDRNIPVTVRFELVSLVAEEILELRALGRSEEIEERIQRWLALAKAGLRA